MLARSAPGGGNCGPALAPAFPTTRAPVPALTRTNGPRGRAPGAGLAAPCPPQGRRLASRIPVAAGPRRPSPPQRGVFVSSGGAGRRARPGLTDSREGPRPAALVAGARGVPRRAPQPRDLQPLPLGAREPAGNGNRVTTR